MGNGPSSSSSDSFSELSKLDKLLTPPCTLKKDELKAEWAVFLEMPFFNDSTRQKLKKLKSKAFWPLLCKLQRTIAKRLSDDAKISESMNLLHEAVALVQAAICIHERVTNVNIADTDYAECKRRIKLLEKDLKMGRQRVAGPIPDETAIGLALDEFISCSWLLDCIKSDLRNMTSENKWNLCLYFEFMTAANIAQNYADRAVETVFLPASREFYRCAMHFFQSDALIEALQTVTGEIEYQEFSARINNRPLPGPVPPENIPSIREQYQEIMNGFPHVIRDDMGQLFPEAMENIILFIQTLRLNRIDFSQLDNSGFIVHTRPGHKTNVSEILLSLSQTEEDPPSNTEKKKISDENEKVKPPLEIIEESKNDKQKVLAGAPSTKTSSKIADLQAQLNLNPAMFMGQQQPKALALKKSKGFVSEEKFDVVNTPVAPVSPDPGSASLTKSPALTSVSTAEEPLLDLGLAHASLERPTRVNPRRPRKAPTFPLAVLDDLMMQS